jgi:hypothetical protein
LRPPARIKDI